MSEDLNYKNSDYEVNAEKIDLNNLEEFFSFLPRDRVERIKKSLTALINEFKNTENVEEKNEIKVSISQILFDESINLFKFKTLPFDTTKETYYMKEGVYRSNGKSIFESFATLILDTSEKIININDVAKRIQNYSIVDENEFFKQPKDKLCIKNGVIDLKTKELIPFENIANNEYHHIKLPWRYNKKAKATKFLKFLKEIISEKDIKTLQEFIGFCLVKGYPKQNFLVFLGSGRNGKSTLLNILTHFFGFSNVTGLSISAFSDTNEDSFMFNGLQNKLVSIAGDAGNKPISGDGLKKLTGEDVIFINRKFREPLNLVNFTKFITSYNEMPKIIDLTDGFWRRLLFIKFQYKFYTSTEFNKLEEKSQFDKAADNSIQNEIINDETEFEGILNWALEGLDRLETQNGFTTLGTTEEIKNRLRRESNSFLAFFEDYVEVKIGDRSKYIIKDLLKEAYFEYCRNEQLNPKSPKEMNLVFEEKGIIHYDRIQIGESRKQVCKGILLKNPYEKYNNDNLIVIESKQNLLGGKNNG